MPYIILLVHCVWTCAKVVLSGCITIIFVLKMMSMLMLHFVVFVQIHHHHVSNKAFCSKKKMNLSLISDTSVNFNIQMSRTPSEYLQ